MRILLAVALFIVPFLAFGAPPPPPVRGNPFTTNIQGTTITSASPLVQTNAPITVTTDNFTDTNSFSPPTFFGRGLSVSKGELDPRSLMAIEGGVADCYAILTNAATICTNLDFTLVLRGRYAISQTWTIPSRLRIRGEPVDYTYKRNPQAPQGAVIVTLGNFTAIQTPRLTPPNDTIGFWAADINIENVYIQGTQLQESPLTSSVGLDISGCRNSVFSKIHIEGFGTAALFENVAEVDTFNFLTQNNYYGGICRRDPASGGRVYDCIIDHWNYANLNNVIAWELDNVRVCKFYGGEFITNLTNAVPKINIVNTKDDSQIAFIGVKAGENQGREALIKADTNGFDNVAVTLCNFAVNNFNQPIMVSEGYFNSFSFTHNALQRTTQTNMVAPIFWAQRPPSDQNNYVRKNAVEVQGNTPHWFDTFVRNDQLMSRPENDYIPDDYVNLNPDPNTGSAGNDGIISVAGDYAFNSDSICGAARIFWQNTAGNNVYTLLTPSDLTRGYTHIYVTAIVYDDNGDQIPILNVQGWGAQGEWNRISQAKIGSYTNSSTGVAFSKWAWCVTVQDQSKATNGLTHVQLFDIYGTTDAGTKANFGLERFSVYASKKENPYGPRYPTGTDVPTTGLEGFSYPQRIRWNDYSGADQSTVAWIARNTAQPGSWNTIGNVIGPLTVNQYEVPYMGGVTNSRLEGSGVYGAASGGKLALGTSSTAAASRFILFSNTNTLPMIWIGNDTAGVSGLIQASDAVDYSIQHWLDSVNNKYMIGESTNHLVFVNGQVGVGGTPSTLFDVSNALRADANATGNETRLLLWDVTAGTFQRVSIGVADSGGSGFRVLRIPN